MIDCTNGPAFPRFDSDFHRNSKKAELSASANQERITSGIPISVASRAIFSHANQSPNLVYSVAS